MLETIATGAGSGFFGVLITWLGFKSRLDSIEKSVATCVKERECEARSLGLAQRVNDAGDRFDRIDSKIEVILQLLIADAKRNGYEYKRSEERRPGDVP